MITEIQGYIRRECMVCKKSKDCVVFTVGVRSMVMCPECKEEFER